MPKFTVMASRIPAKNTFFMFLGSFVCAVCAAFLLNFTLSGPKLGAHYDFLLRKKPPPPVSREILIIDAGEYVDGGDLFSVLMTLTEMDSSALIQTGKIPSSSSTVMFTEEEILRRFSDEYHVLGENIRKLFEGIRMGYITPGDAPSYIESLVELSERGRDRLLAAFIGRDEALLQAVSVFGNYHEVDSKPFFDSDGKIRRVKPLDRELSFEHPVYSNLKKRYAVTQIESSDKGEVLWLRKSDGSEIDIPLDRNGSIITAWNCTFRSVPIDLFREYEETGYAVNDAVNAAGALGAFKKLPAEKSPLFLGDYCLLLQHEMINNPNSENRLSWRKAKQNYLMNLSEFLNGPAEMNLVNDYEKLIADENALSTNALVALLNERGDLIKSFTAMREAYNKLSSVRQKIEDELVSSFCIIGPRSDSVYSALLANALITGSSITPFPDLYVLLLAVSSAFILLLIIFRLHHAILLITGIILSILFSLVCAGVFIFYSVWIDPLVIIGSSLLQVWVMFICKCVYLRNRARNFKRAYGTAASANKIKKLINAGSPDPKEINVEFAAVVAIKDIDLLGKENREKMYEAGTAKKEFFEAVKDIIFNAGAVIAGYEGDTVLACFGSPLDNTVNPVTRACSLVRDLLNYKKSSWHLAMDAGECTFLWSPETGFCANGRPAVRAKVLVSKAQRFNARALITEAIRSKISYDGKKIGFLYNERDSVYEFPVK